MNKFIRIINRLLSRSEPPSSNDLVFTLGKPGEYLRYFLENPKPKKAGKMQWARGGSVWRTLDDVIAYLEETGQRNDYAVFGVLASWEHDTAPDPTCPPERPYAFRQLTRPAEIVLLTRGENRAVCIAGLIESAPEPVE